MNNIQKLAELGQSIWMDNIQRRMLTGGGLQTMIEDDRWCPDVVTQVSSVTRALQEVAVGVLNDHLRHCVMAAAKTSDTDGQARLDEVAATIRQVVRL